MTRGSNLLPFCLFQSLVAGCSFSMCQHLLEVTRIKPKRSALPFHGFKHFKQNRFITPPGSITRMFIKCLGLAAFGA